MSTPGSGSRWEPAAGTTPEATAPLPSTDAPPSPGRTERTEVGRFGRLDHRGPGPDVGHDGLGPEGPGGWR